MENRRNLLKTLSVAGAAGTINTWKKPVVNAVLLPSHAMTSTVLGSADSNISQGPGRNRPARVCLVSDSGDYNVAPVAFGFSPDPGAGVPFTAQLFINGALVDTGSGVTDVDENNTYAFIRFKGNAPGATFGDPVSYSITVQGYEETTGSTFLNDCTNCVAAGQTNPDTNTCTPQSIYSE